MGQPTATGQPAPVVRTSVEYRVTRVLKHKGKHATVELTRIAVTLQPDGSRMEVPAGTPCVRHLERLGKKRWRDQLTGRPTEFDFAAA